MYVDLLTTDGRNLNGMNGMYERRLTQVIRESVHDFENGVHIFGSVGDQP